VELEDQRRDAQPQRRYLEEQPTDSFESPRYNTARYRDEPSFNTAPNEEPSFEDPRFEEPQIKEQRFDDSSLNDDPAPRRAMPASRRPVQKISEPLDVEPIRDDLDDPW
jgi:hypothetical protein